MADQTKSDAAKTMQDPDASKEERSEAAKTMSPNAKTPESSKKD